MLAQYNVAIHHQLHFYQTKLKKNTKKLPKNVNKPEHQLRFQYFLLFFFVGRSRRTTSPGLDLGGQEFRRELTKPLRVGTKRLHLFKQHLVI